MRAHLVLASVIALAATSHETQAQVWPDSRSPPGQQGQIQNFTPPGQANKREVAPPGQSRSQANIPPGQAKKSAGHALDSNPPRATDNQLNDVLRAVERGEALPLARIIRIARSRSAGRVIDAQLVRTDGAMFYRLTLINGEGYSWHEFYAALTGKPVDR